MHMKSYFFDRKCVISFTHTIIPIFPNQISRIFQILNPTPKSIFVGCHCFAFSNHPFLLLIFSLLIVDEARENP
jgi:hypothetical protein